MVAVAALGGCHADHLEALAEELTPLSQEFSGERAKACPRLVQVWPWNVLLPWVHQC